ncbi:swarming motility protein YbiA [Thecamonas trahens ATCC 50062]|uniref:Swarming motility protein YbiA n=1 Tax=Thecamonas trahens ATCC 50062 TaxID=461836 RepID=A0A0L0DDH4_THETB|nr:swarming motility protein YbiA [Thecamonas trahens ATCC 50062]KNC50151.1 swarming motility protein YbiA [Thecamonas trahens ATCC 50062]|eukprot:XP_013756997.1 swarming motility protein YbiA [Thecamonas trahens ATCC 50062]
MSTSESNESSTGSSNSLQLNISPRNGHAHATGSTLATVVYFGSEKSDLVMREHVCLNNEYIAPFTLSNVEYATAEHCYQAAKVRAFDPKAAIAVSRALTAADARHMAKDAVQAAIAAGVYNAPAWARRREQAMFEALKAKCVQNQHILQVLLETGDATLVEDSPADPYWGGTAPGARNRLGVLLMELRSTLAGTHSITIGLAQSTSDSLSDESTPPSSPWRATLPRSPARFPAGVCTLTELATSSRGVDLGSMVGGEPQIKAVLGDTPPFNLLPLHALARLARGVRYLEYSGGALLATPGGVRDDGHAFVLLEGSVVASTSDGSESTVAPFVLFGEHYALMGVRSATYSVPRGGMAHVLAIPSALLLAVLEPMTPVALALATSALARHPATKLLAELHATIRAAAATGNEFDVGALVARYAALEAALYPEIGTGLAMPAWQAAVAVLPLPLFVPADVTLAGPTWDAGCVEEASLGKVTLADGESHLVGLCTALAVHWHQMTKLQTNMCDDMAAVEGVLQAAGLVDDDLLRAALDAHDTLPTVHLAVESRAELDTKLTSWSHKLALAVGDVLAVDTALEAVGIDVVFGGHAACADALSPWCRDAQARIEAWAHARSVAADVVAAYLAAHPDEAASRRAADASAGIHVIDSGVCSGPAVVVVDTGRGADAERRALVNVAAMSGEAAAAALRALILVFGENIRSINMVTAADRLAGRKGDFVLASHAVLAGTGHVVALDAGMDDEAVVLDMRASCGVQRGPVLTAPACTPEPMLGLYVKAYGCVARDATMGTMAQEMQNAREMGLLRRTSRARFVAVLADRVSREAAATMIEFIHRATIFDSHHTSYQRSSSLTIDSMYDRSSALMAE